MNMTYHQYIQNPMGIANSVFSHREMYRQLYTDKLKKIMVREVANENRYKHRLYKDGDRYLAYLKIPSEGVPGFYYDTVVEFTPPKGNNPLDSTLKNYNVRFYSNSPSFVFTFAHAFIKNDMFIKDLLPKMSKEAIRKKAVEKNPRNNIGYEKSIYFAYIIMNELGLFVKAKYAETYSKTALLSYITEADVMIDRRQKGEVKYRKEKAQEKKNKERLRTDRKHLEDEVDDGDRAAAQHAHRVANVKFSPVIKPIKNSKVIKAVNKVKKTPKKRG